MPDTDTTTGCHTCHAPTGDDGNLCRTHTGALLADLRAVPALLPELEVTLTRQDKLLLFNDRKSTAETPLQWNENAAQVGWELAVTLQVWAEDIAEQDEDERDRLADVDPRDLPALCAWLKRSIDTIRRHPHAGTLHDEINNAVRRASRAIDHPAIRSRFWVGPCPEIVDGGNCDGDVWTYLASSENELSYMRCLACEAKWDSSRWLRVGPRIEARRQQLLPRAAA